MSDRAFDVDIEYAFFALENGLLPQTEATPVKAYWCKGYWFCLEELDWK